MPRKGIPVGLFKHDKLVDVFPSAAAATRFLGAPRKAFHQVAKRRQRRLYKGCYEVKRHVEGNLFEEHLENVFKEYEVPAKKQVELDTEGLINLFKVLNAPCYCEERPDYRQHLAGLLLKRYRHARAQGNDYWTSVAYARSIAGIECCVHDRPINRWWKTFFDYQEASRILHKGPTISNKGIKL